MVAVQFLNYPSYMKYAKLIYPSVISLDDLFVVHVVILVWCIQISGEASYSKYLFIIARTQKGAFLKSN